MIRSTLHKGAIAGYRALLAWLLLAMSWAHAAEPPALVLYPRAPPPYAAAFAQMIAGLTRSLGTPPPTLVLSEPDPPDRLQPWLRRYPMDIPLVTLGQRPLTIVEQTETGRPWVIGGVYGLPGEFQAPGISLTIDPALFLDHLQQLLPTTRTVVVVHHARQAALIPSIQQAAKQRGLTVQPVAVTDTVDAVRQLTRMFATVDEATALWFTRHTLSLNTELLFPFVLEETWKRRLPAFSDTPAHARRGLLFALYPDYIGVGEELGTLLKETPGTSPGMRFTRAAHWALNTRTAQHLGLMLDAETVHRATTVFPER
jgi:putative ABC transport system substrate-binding protein